MIQLDFDILGKTRVANYPIAQGKVTHKLSSQNFNGINDYLIVNCEISALSLILFFFQYVNSI